MVKIPRRIILILHIWAVSKIKNSKCMLFFCKIFSVYSSISFYVSKHVSSCPTMVCEVLLK